MLHVIPSIDLLEGRVVRLMKGDYRKVTQYASNPIELARSWRGLCPRMHVVDLDGAREGLKRQQALIGGIVQSFGEGVQIGGGIRTLAAIEDCFALGVTRVVLGTVALHDPELLATAARRFPGRVIVALDARDGRVATSGWTEQSDRLASDVIREIATLPVDSVLYTDIERDGMQTGPNLDLTMKLAQQGGLPVIASGGVGTLDHLRALARCAQNSRIIGAIIGRALHEKTFTLREALDSVAAAAQTPV